MKVLVVGGAGYIGSVVAQELLAQGFAVTVYDNLSTGHSEAIPEGATFIHGDLEDREKLRTLFSQGQVDAVMHFAGLIMAGESMLLPGLYFHNNVANVISLLNTMLEFGAKPFVFSSSAAVYGEPRTVPIPERASLRPANPYGESKLMVERILKWLDVTKGLRYASLRYFNAAGAWAGLGEDHCPESHLIPLAIHTALGRRKELVIHGTDYPTRDGTCVRDYVHVIDLARAHILALEHLDQGSIICNLGSETGYTVREVIGEVQRVSGAAFPVVEGARRPGDPAVLVASSRKAQKRLGWRREHSDLEKIVFTAWEWHKKHPNGYGD